MKVAVVSYIKGEDHTRARTIRKGFLACANNEVVLISNKQNYRQSYLGFLIKFWRESTKHAPDVFVLTYKSSRLLLPTLLIAGSRPVIYDEFINPLEDIIYEHHSFKPNSTQAKLIGSIYRHLVKHCRFILSDTDAHAQYSARLNRLSLDHYWIVPISADERVFHAVKSTKTKTNKKFGVLFIGDSSPRDGLKFVIDAAIRLRNENQIEFSVVSDDKVVARLVEEAQFKGAQINYVDQLSDRQLARLINHHDLCLAGPFGNTVQARLILSEQAYRSLASAKPVIIGRARVAGVLINLKNCLVVSQASAKALVEKISWSYQHKRKLQTIAIKGFNTYETIMSKKIVAQECQSILDQIL